MSRLRLLLLLTGLGALLTGAPVLALVAPAADGEPLPVVSRSARAINLLDAAVVAARSRVWSGTQHVVATRSGEPRFTVLHIQHTPGAGSTVRVLSSDDQTLAVDALDQNLLALLARHYDLVVAGTRRCADRPALLVEARRPGRTGPTALAGRFWLDTATGLLLRRDVLDEDGAVVRSSAFVSLTLGPAAKASPAAFTTGEVLRPSGRKLADAELASLAASGWPVVRTLPSRLELFEARLHDGPEGDVLQLSYSDGLSTLSLFVQPGELPDTKAGDARPMGGGTVWVSPGATERVVWSGDGRTWTLVSDAPQSTVEGAVIVLPHLPGATDDGVLERVWRGMSRVGSWLNPFE